jgi:hypothetical protein
MQAIWALLGVRAGGFGLGEGLECGAEVVAAAVRARLLRRVPRLTRDDTADSGTFTWPTQNEKDQMSRTSCSAPDAMSHPTETRSYAHSVDDRRSCGAWVSGSADSGEAVRLQSDPLRAESGSKRRQGRCARRQV